MTQRKVIWKCFSYKEDICGYFKRWNKDGLFPTADLSADFHDIYMIWRWGYVKYLTYQ